jgi:hypothetical protein
MTPRKNLNIDLTRRHWMVLAASALTGCGGGGGATAASAPGTGGTGIYAQGSISGFGSVILNGVKFDDTAAEVWLDGVRLRSSDLRLGMVAAIQGERGADLTLGTASHIDVWSIAQGLVTQGAVTPGVAGQFTVSGMTVQTDSHTVFDGVSAPAQLTPGQRVAVWGLQTGADGSTWNATRVAVVTGTPVVSSGLVSGTSAQFFLNGWRLTGTLASTLSAGQLARVQGTLLSPDSTDLTVTGVKSLESLASVQPEGEIEIEGFVTTPLLNGRFMLGAMTVDASTATYLPTTFVLTVGARVEVYGRWQSGVLKAREVEFEDEQTLNEVEITAVIESFTSLADFVVRDQRCDATNAIISHGTATDVRLGVSVKVQGTKNGDVLMVTVLELED